MDILAVMLGDPGSGLSLMCQQEWTRAGAAPRGSPDHRGLHSFRLFRLLVNSALRLSLAPVGLPEGVSVREKLAGPRLREPSLAWHLQWGITCLWETQSASRRGQDPCLCPHHPSVSGMGKEVSDPQGQKALGTRSVVAESLLLGPSQVTGF